MNCTRCGTEDSVFWYPYSFAVTLYREPVTGDRYDVTQRFTLCDRYQCDFVKFMDKASFKLAHPYVKEATE